MTLQRRDLGREDDVFAGDTVIERLFAEPVAYQVKRAGRAVAIGKGEHSVDPLDRAPHPIATDQLKQDFGIGMVAQRHAEAPQFGGEGPIPVYFAIEHESVAGGFVDARLRAAGDVDDGQPRVAQSDASVDKDTAAVGSAMPQRSIHPGKDSARIGARISEPGNAAHQPTTFSRPLLGRATAECCDTLSTL